MQDLQVFVALAFGIVLTAMIRISCRIVRLGDWSR